MARTASKPPKAKPLLSRNEVIGLCKRWLKADKYNPILDPMIVYGLIKQLPNRDFWMAYTLPFSLNSTLWFKGKDGQAQLARDWATFNLDMPAQEEYKLETAKVGLDVVIDKRPRTVADLLK